MKNDRDDSDIEMENRTTNTAKLANKRSSCFLGWFA